MHGSEHLYGTGRRATEKASLSSNVEASTNAGATWTIETAYQFHPNSQVHLGCKMVKRRNANALSYIQQLTTTGTRTHRLP